MLEAEKEPEPVRTLRREIFREIDEIQFPDLIVEIDSQTRFSWSLLGREPASPHELLCLYGALLAHGTTLDPAEVALMIKELSAQEISDAMRVIEDGHVLRKANEGVIEFMYRHPIVSMWGDGTMASSDAMSLDATRHLWNARVDPKRRVRGIGVYTHVLNCWGIIYDQPVLIGQRQAGVAIEGMVRQTSALDLERLAVDTLGYTDFALAIAKLLGFDLCPRLKNLRERQFHVPRTTTIPDSLLSVTKRDVYLNHLHSGWDELIRVVASIDSGITSATLALMRFGATSRADPIHKAGTALGRMLLTLFLCDMVTNPSFRRTVLRILLHGESVNSLQRIIYNGGISTQQGRHRDALFAISGSLVLLTNLVMAWNTHQMQRVLDRWHMTGRKPVEPDHMRRIAPVHSRNINFRGECHFPIGKHYARLIPSYAAGTAQIPGDSRK